MGGVITPSKQTKILADDTNGLEFYTGASSANERMVIDKDGNVGICTNSPGAKLEIKATEGANENSHIDKYDLLIKTIQENANECFGLAFTIHVSNTCPGAAIVFERKEVMVLIFILEQRKPRMGIVVQG